MDLQGRVIGINSAIASPTGFYSGYGFAVPINMARRVAEDLMRDGRVHRPMIGVEIRDATSVDAEVFRLPSPDGAVVAAEPRGPAARAGLRMGDVIVKLDGQAVNNSGELMEMVMRKRPGDRVALEVVRYGERRRVELRLEEYASTAVAERDPRRPAMLEDERVEAAVEPGKLGFRAQVVTPEIAAGLRMERAEGVVVSAVDPSGPAAQALAPRDGGGARERPRGAHAGRPPRRRRRGAAGTGGVGAGSDAGREGDHHQLPREELRELRTRAARGVGGLRTRSAVRGVGGHRGGRGWGGVGSRDTGVNGSRPSRARAGRPLFVASTRIPKPGLGRLSAGLRFFLPARAVILRPAPARSIL